MRPMPSIFRRFLAAAALIVTAGQAGAQAPQAPNLGAQLQALATTMDQVWNARDAAGLSAYYAGDATLTIGATALKGRPAIEAYFSQSLKNVPAKMTHRTVIKRTETIGDLLAVDTAVFLELEGEQGGRVLVREFFTFTLLRRQGEDWKVVAARAIPLGAVRAAGT